MKVDERVLLEDTVLQLAAILREKTFARDVLARESYQRRMKDTYDADRAYMMLELTEQQRKIIDDMLDKRETANGRELAWSYLLGMKDALLFLRRAGFLDMFLMEDSDTKEE